LVDFLFLPLLRPGGAGFSSDFGGGFFHSRNDLIMGMLWMDGLLFGLLLRSESYRVVEESIAVKEEFDTEERGYLEDVSLYDT
jgi:hypothetical protein